MILIFFCTFSFHFYHLENLKERKLKSLSLESLITEIPADDLVTLEDFFHSLIVHYNLGYVLYGDKPMATVPYINPSFSKSLNLYDIDPDLLKMMKGVECWKKYYRIFSSKDFEFIFFENSAENKFNELVLINKSAFINTANQHIDKFKRVFGNKITGEKLLSKISIGTNFWKYNLDYEMIGILLGYGESNATYFQRRADINPKIYGWKFTLKKLQTLPRQGYASINDEILDLQKNFQPLRDEKPLDRGYMVLPSFFVTSDSKDTLHHNFGQQRKKLIKIYRNGSFFKKSMTRYAQES